MNPISQGISSQRALLSRNITVLAGMGAIACGVSPPLGGRRGKVPNSPHNKKHRHTDNLPCRRRKTQTAADVVTIGVSPRRRPAMRQIGDAYVAANATVRGAT